VKGKPSQHINYFLDSLSIQRFGRKIVIFYLEMMHDKNKSCWWWQKWYYKWEKCNMFIMKKVFHVVYTSGYNNRNHCWMKNSLQTFIITKLLLMKNQFVALTRNKSSIRKIILSDRILSCCRKNIAINVLQLFYYFIFINVYNSNSRNLKKII